MSTRVDDIMFITLGAFPIGSALSKVKTHVEGVSINGNTSSERCTWHGKGLGECDMGVVPE